MDATFWTVLVGGVVAAYTGTLGYLKSRDAKWKAEAKAKIAELEISERECHTAREIQGETITRLEREIRAMNDKHRDLLERLNKHLEKP